MSEGTSLEFNAKTTVRYIATPPLSVSPKTLTFSFFELACRP